jgi:hypothetical protein
MTLYVVYRSYGGANTKERPAWFSKELALRSMLRAVEEAGAEILFLNDGPVGDDLLALMHSYGEVVTLPRLGLQGSYLEALRLPIRRGWAPQDIAYFAEDDYLYMPDALLRLANAAEVLPADYYSLYGLDPALGIRQDPNVGRHQNVVPRGWAPPAPVECDGQRWIGVPGATSTFGARVRVLEQDWRISWQACLGNRKTLRDRDISLTLQGYQSHPWPGLARDLVMLSPGSLSSRARRAFLAPFKAAMNLRAHRRPARRRVLMCAVPNLATHLEPAYMAPDRDWDQLARETADWSPTRAGRIGIPGAEGP